MDILNEKDRHHNRRRRHLSERVPLFLISNITFIIINVILLLGGKQWVHFKDIHCPRVQHFGNAFKHSYTTYDDSKIHNPLAGFNHTDELKDAWGSLLAPGIFRVSKEEAIKLGKLKEQSVRFGNGDVALSLNVYQELYCLKFFKLDLLNPSSPSHISSPALEAERLDKCINIIMQQRLCRADVSVESWYWKKQDYTTPWPRPKSQRLCMAWDQLEDWLTQPGRRVLKDGNGGMLDEPVYGPHGFKKPVRTDLFFDGGVMFG
ncbi:protein of unknown function (DUF3328) domain containing protein [Rhypophila sp. PSN 637]